MMHACVRWWGRVASNSAKGSRERGNPQKVPIGDVTSSIKRTDTRGGRGSIWPQRTFLGARKSPLHLCTGVLVLTHLCTCACACSCVPVHSACAQNAARKWCAQHHWLIDSCRCWFCICIFGLAEGQSCQISASNHQEIFTFDSSHPYPPTNLLSLFLLLSLLILTRSLQTDTMSAEIWRQKAFSFL